jgi:hypothetical protein
MDRLLLIFPCSAGKDGESLSTPLKSAYIQDYIDKDLAQGLIAARNRVFKDAILKGSGVTFFDRNSPRTAALAFYSGYQYQVPGFKSRVAKAIRSGVHCLVISGGYGLIRAEEPIHNYEAHMTRTHKYWKDIIPKALSAYVKRNRIDRTFIACSKPYAEVLKRYDWSGDREVFWYVATLPRRKGGGPQVKVPRLIGKAIVELIDSNFKIDTRWKTTWPD